jgi:hypothetical protein
MGLRDIWARSLEGREAASPDLAARRRPYQAGCLSAKPTAHDSNPVDGIEVASRAQKTGNSAELAIPIHD